MPLQPACPMCVTKAESILKMAGRTLCAQLPRTALRVAVLAGALLLLPCISSFAPPKHAVKTRSGPGISACARMSAKRSVFPRADLLRQLAVPLAGAAAFRTGAAIAVIGQPRMPPVTGPFGTVGVRIIRVQGAGGDSCRAKVFYPAQDRSEEEDREPQAVADAPYCTEGRETSDGMAGLVGFRQLGLSFLLAHLADAKSGCRLGAPPDAKGTLPLLVYSHGYGGNMDMATYFMRSGRCLATHDPYTLSSGPSTRRPRGEPLTPNSCKTLTLTLAPCVCPTPNPQSFAYVFTCIRMYAYVYAPPLRVYVHKYGT